MRLEEETEWNRLCCIDYSYATRDVQETIVLLYTLTNSHPRSMLYHTILMYAYTFSSGSLSD
jgi:hypothetical protein